MNGTLKEKELDSYLVAKIADAKLREAKVKRFAELGLEINDVKDIYETNNVESKPDVKKTAEVVPSTPQGKVKLQTASTTEEESRQ